MESNFQEYAFIETGVGGSSGIWGRGEGISLKGGAYWREPRTWRLNGNIVAGS